MKKIIIPLLMAIALSSSIEVKAQANELAQLALDIEKLTQFKGILSDLKKGYQIVSRGYGTIKNLSEGNFSIHKTFLDGLMQVSPTVKKYSKVAAIINDQLILAKSYKSALSNFRNSNVFNPDEMEYIGHVYENLVNSSLKNLDDLINVVTANKMRMSDDERLNAIDQIYDDMEDKLSFLNSFNMSTSILGVQRTKEQKDIKVSEIINGIRL